MGERVQKIKVELVKSVETSYKDWDSALQVGTGEEDMSPQGELSQGEPSKVETV